MLQPLTVLLHAGIERAFRCCGALRLCAACLCSEGRGVLRYCGVLRAARPPRAALSSPAQEASSYQPAVRPERRRQVVDEMMAYAPQALQILASCLAAPLSRAREQALDAFTSWLKLTGGTGLNGAMLMQSPLVRCGVGAEARHACSRGASYGVLEAASRPPWLHLLCGCTCFVRWCTTNAALVLCCFCRAALEGLRSSDTFFAAVDAVIELIYCTSHRGRPKDDMAPLVQLIVPEVMALKPR